MLPQTKIISTKLAPNNKKQGPFGVVKASIGGAAASGAAGGSVPAAVASSSSADAAAHLLVPAAAAVLALAAGTVQALSAATFQAGPAGKENNVFNDVKQVRSLSFFFLPRFRTFSFSLCLCLSHTLSFDERPKNQNRITRRHSFAALSS